VAGSDRDRYGFEPEGLKRFDSLSATHSDGLLDSEPDVGDAGIGQFAGDEGGVESSTRIRLQFGYTRSDAGFDSFERFVGAGLGTGD
jgi:hypothetical protein